MDSVEIRNEKLCDSNKSDPLFERIKAEINKKDDSYSVVAHSIPEDLTGGVAHDVALEISRITGKDTRGVLERMIDLPSVIAEGINRYDAVNIVFDLNNIGVSCDYMLTEFVQNYIWHHRN